MLHRRRFGYSFVSTLGFAVAIMEVVLLCPSFLLDNEPNDSEDSHTADHSRSCRYSYNCAGVKNVIFVIICVSIVSAGFCSYFRVRINIRSRCLEGSTKVLLKLAFFLPERRWLVVFELNFFLLSFENYSVGYL
jgi:hypothetical protein